MKKKIINGHNVQISDEPCEYIDDEMSEEYDLSKKELTPNPYAKQNETITIKLESDVAKYFKTSKQVNSFLRTQIKLLQKFMV